ncbi:MAG: EAL domain-containing protein [Acidothermus sp.]|nr:EAL domain-containing protein [Acidothermus sp.]
MAYSIRVRLVDGEGDIFAGSLGGAVHAQGEQSLARRIRAVAGAAWVALSFAVAQIVTVGERPALWQVGIVALLVVFAHVGVIRTRNGGSRQLYVWQATALALGLFLVPGPYLVVISILGPITLSVLLRHEVRKAVFNASVACLSSSAAVLVSLPFGIYRHSIKWERVFQPEVFVGLMLATLTAILLSPLLTALPVSAERHRPITSGLGPVYRTAIFVWARNFVLALLIAAALARSFLLALVVLAAAIPIHLLSAERTALARERAAWHRLQRAIDHLRSVDLHDVVREAAAAATEMVRADAAQIVVSRAAEEPLSFLADETGRERSESDFVSRATSVVPVRLATPEGDIGTLRLFFFKPVTLTATEWNTLDAFANALAVALANAVKFSALHREAEERIRAAHRDPVTGLGNLLMLEKEFDAAMRSRLDDDHVAIAVIGLDRFAEVNDILGAHPADLMLRSVAERLASVVRRCDVVGRLHGAEYVLLLRELAGPEAATAQAESAVRELGGTITAEGLDIAVDAHTGVACVPEDGVNLTDLLRRARLAMYKARNLDVPVYRYRPELEPPALAQVEMLRDLKDALGSDQFVLHYQPKFSLKSGLPVAAEALVRWQHPEEGLIPPGQFVPLLERCGLIGNLTRYVLGAAIAECATWYREGLPLAVAVNLSARNLLDEDLPRFVLDALASSGLPADRLICEITETAVFSRSPTASSILEQLRAAGVGLSLDDFCTGYSSLALLRERTIDEIKIDRSFVSDLGIGRRSTEIVTALIDLAHRCDIIVTAEGIETKEQQRLLAALGCDYAQGFLLAKPMPAPLVRQLFVDSLRVPGGLGAMPWHGSRQKWAASLP